MPGRLSLTARLTALYTLVSAAVLVGLALLVAVATDQHFVDLDRGFLQDKAGLVQTIVQGSATPDVLAARLDELQASHHGLFIELRQGETPVFASGDPVFPAGLALAGGDAETTDWTLNGTELRGMRVPIEATSGPPLQLLIALDTVHHSHFMDELKRSLLGYVVLALLVSGVLGWWAARSGLAPLRILKERALLVTAQKLDQRMPVQAVPVEFADLAHSLNTMLARLQADFERLQDFSSDLAHELRTPINNLLTQTQVSLAQKRDVDTYREVLASNAEEFQRLARMVSDMLFLAKTEHGIELPHQEPVALGDEVLALFDFYDAVADERQIRLRLLGQAEVLGDRLMLRRAISNLLSNALRHSPAGGEVEVALDQCDGQISLCISNSGAPIDPGDLPRLFDRFYRVDKARAHPSSDGTGLGLSITQAIMKAHGGVVTVSSVAGRTSFCLVFQQAGASLLGQGPTYG